MNKQLPLLATCALLCLASCSGNRSRRNDIDRREMSDTETTAPELQEKPLQAIPPGAQALIEAYPQFIGGYEAGELIFTDGSRMLYDNGREKDFEQMLDHSDPEDMFYIRYEEPQGSPAYLADAGRSRCEALFKKMYGSTEAEVRRGLVSVEWFGQEVLFASANGAADSLRAVARELAGYPDLRPYLKSSGTFNWRSVRGAKRQSAHSYGIAFDIGVDHADYWLWKNPGAGETDRLEYANRIPRKIVEIFRRHGFIWGGAWYHYDTMHFEYRPEILGYAAN